MKTFTKTLLAAGLGVFGMLGAAEAALPYGYGSASYGSRHGIAAGGCYVPATASGYGSSYRPTIYGRSAHDDRFHALPYPSTHPNGSDDRWGDDFGYDTSSRLPSKSSTYHDRYGSSPLFEPWRPANASTKPRRTW